MKKPKSSPTRDEHFDRKGIAMSRDKEKAEDKRDHGQMPEKIPDTPENVMRAIVTTPPKAEDDWRYLRKDR